MKTKKSLFGILVIILTFSIATSCRRLPEKIQLQLRLEEGKSYNTRMIAEQKISQTIQGQQQNMTQTIGMGYTFDVQKLDSDGTASVQVNYRSVVFKQDGSTGKIEYDSSNPPPAVPPAAMGFAALAGQSFSMKISRDGYVKDVQGVDEMLTNIMKSVGLPDGPLKVAMEKNLREQFGDQTLKETMKNMLAIYPENPVGVGDSWKKRVIISKGFPMILDSTWTLKARKGGVAFIEARSIVEPNSEAAPIEMGPMRLSFGLSGEQKGTMELQEATGWTTRAKFTQKFSGQVKVESAPQIPEGISWPISIESIISFEPF